MKMAEKSPKGYKTPWEKEKLLVTRNFSFSHCVFKRLVLQKRKNKGFFWETVKTSQSTFSPEDKTLGLFFFFGMN